MELVRTPIHGDTEYRIGKSHKTQLRDCHSLAAVWIACWDFLVLTMLITILPTLQGQVTVTVVRIHQMRIQNELVNISTRLFSYFQHGGFDPSPFLGCFNMLLIQSGTFSCPQCIRSKQRFLPCAEQQPHTKTPLWAASAAVWLLHLLPILSFLISHLLVLTAGWHWQHLLPGADKPLDLLGRWLRFRLLHHRIRELPCHPAPVPAHPQDSPQC